MNLETETLQMITRSLEQFAKGSHNPSKDQKVLRRIRKIKRTKNAQLGLAAAQWVLQYNMDAFNNCENSRQMSVVMKNATNDLEHALMLLEIPFTNEKQSLQALVLSADIAQKVSRFDKLGPLYKQLKIKAIANPQLNFMALSIAPTMGDWKTFYSQCCSMEKEYSSFAQSANSAGPKPSMVEALHQLAESGMPDLGVIYSYVKELKLYDLPSIDSSKLFEKSVDVISSEVEMSKIEVDDDSRRKEIEEMFEKEKEKELNLDEIMIAVNGGLVLFSGISRDIPQMLVGPYFDENRIDAEAYMDLQVNEQDEEGNSKLGFNTPEFTQEIMGSMSPDLIQAIQSGELSPETLFEVMGMVNQGGTEAVQSMPNLSPELQAGFVEFSKRFEEKRPELMKRFGQSLVRQQERVSLKKVDDGYEGSYVVRNYNPMDKGEETSIEIKLKLKCEHLPPPAKSNELEIISSGVDDLQLD